MQSQIVALLMPKGMPLASMLVRRADGRLDLRHVDARIARAAAAAANRDALARPMADSAGMQPPVYEMEAPAPV